MSRKPGKLAAFWDAKYESDEPGCQAQEFALYPNRILLERTRFACDEFEALLFGIFLQLLQASAGGC